MRSKLKLGFLAVILLLWAICVYTTLSSMSVQESFSDLKDDIVPGAISMTEMDGTANQIAHGTMEYILTGDAAAKAEVQTASEWLESSLAAHREHETHIGDIEKKEAGKVEEEGKKLISAANEIINLKDQGVSTEVLLKKENEELHEALYPFVEHVIGHKAEHLEELSAVEAKIHGRHDAHIRYIPILGLSATFIALLVGLFVDRFFMRYVTERKRTEQERLKMEKFQGVIEMAGAVCHELNQPMQATLGYSELLMAEMSEDNPVNRDIDEIRAQILKMGEITKKLTRITRYETRDYIEGRKIIDIDKAAGKGK